MCYLFLKRLFTYMCLHSFFGSVRELAICFSDDEESPEGIMRSIATDIRLHLPIEAVLPSEKIRVPETGEVCIVSFFCVCVFFWCFCFLF